MLKGASKSIRVCSIFVLLSALAGVTLKSWGSSQKTKGSDRPQVPWGITSLSPLEIGVYNSKAEPAAEVLQALNAMNLNGWQVIRKYYRHLGEVSEKGGGSVNPRDAADTRFYAAFSNEDPGRSPIPLISMICSLDAGAVSGNLKSLRAELLDAIQVEDYSHWSEERLHVGIFQLTTEQTTTKGVKYRGAKRTLTFRESVQLFAMSVAFLEKDTKWKKWEDEAERIGYTIPTPPDMHDFANRLKHQMPMTIPPGATRGFLLYRAGWDIGQPVTKSEYEERADVMMVKRRGMTFEAEQFPVYFTNDQKTWNPEWIDPDDEVRDKTLLGRKVELQWTRFDGPYYWYKKEQLNGEATYRSTVRFEKDQIIITAERFMALRGGVVRSWRDPQYDPEKMRRVAGGLEVAPDLLVVEPPEWDIHSMWRNAGRNIDNFCYQQGNRELFWYGAGGNSWSSSVFLRPEGKPVLRPVQPVTAASGGITARFNGEGALRPSETDLLTQDQMTSGRVAVGLLNRCLEGAQGQAVIELRVSLPRENDNTTPIYFYRSPKTTAVQKSPSALIVTLPEGYYSSYQSVFNRLLWVLERPFDSDPAKVTAINQAMLRYLREDFPREGSKSGDPTLVAWSQILRDGEADGLFNVSILPTPPKPVSSAVVPASDWFRLVTSSDRPGLSEEQKKSSEFAIGLTNLYLASAAGDAANAWRRRYPLGTSVDFGPANQTDQGQAREEVREITTSEGERHTESHVRVELPDRAYTDNWSTLIWMLGVLEVSARGRDHDIASGGQGTGVTSVLQYLRQLDATKDPCAAQVLSRLGLSYKTLAAWVPDVPDMFLNAQPAGHPSNSDDQMGGGKSLVSVTGTVTTTMVPVVVLEFPAGIGGGSLAAAEKTATTEDVRILNLYLGKKDEKKDRGADYLRRAIGPTTELCLYRSGVTSVHRKPGAGKGFLVGTSLQGVTYSPMFLELLRVIEMQDDSLIKSPGKREDVALSLKRFLESYAKGNPGDEAAAELNQIDIKAMTELR
jgi:hypothetical protein